jgi:hypothetical protein
MPSAELDNLVSIGKLTREAPADAEYQGLLKSGKARLADARSGKLALESRFDLAYSAAHAVALAALRRLGYRPKDRYIVFQALEHTVGAARETVRILAKAHTMRNTAEYEGYFEPDEKLVSDTIAAVEQVAKALDAMQPDETAGA